MRHFVRARRKVTNTGDFLFHGTELETEKNYRVENYDHCLSVYTQCHIHLEIVKMIKFVLCMFYHNKDNVEGWGYSSGLQCLPSMCEVLGSILRAENKTKQKLKRER